MASSSEGDHQEEEHFFLPEAVVRAIAGHLVEDEAPGNRMLYLLGMAGVCKQWRELASEVPEGVPIAFDGVDNALSAQATLSRFRKQPKELKRRVFLAVSQLFTGES